MAVSVSRQPRSRKRVGTTPDMVRMSNGVSRPGVDPRITSSMAYALDESMFDNDHGDFVDVVLLPSELEITCRVPQSYAGKDFGSNDGRIHKDDELYVGIPDGDPAHGGIVLARFWNGADTPPQLVKDNPKDTVRVVEKDLNVRWAFDGKSLMTVKIGDFEVTIDNSASPTVAHFKTDSGDVFKLTKDGLELGVSPSDMMALASLVKSEISKLRDTVNSNASTFNSHDHIFTGVITAGSPVTQTQTAPVTTMSPASPMDSPASVGDVKSDFVKSK